MNPAELVLNAPCPCIAGLLHQASPTAQRGSKEERRQTYHRCYSLGIDEEDPTLEADSIK